jgi:hypothetical protein
VREVTPAQLGLAGAAQLIVVIRTCTQKGKTTTARTYFVTSRPAAQLSPLQILFLRRSQWGIEGTCHQRLDVSLYEDKSRVRNPSAVAVLGLLSRISLALFQRDSQRPQPVRDKTYPVWSFRLIRRPRPILDLFLERCLPP